MRSKTNLDLIWDKMNQLELSTDERADFRSGLLARIAGFCPRDVLQRAIEAEAGIVTELRIRPNTEKGVFQRTADN